MYRWCLCSYAAENQVRTMLGGPVWNKLESILMDPLELGILCVSMILSLPNGCWWKDRKVSQCNTSLFRLQPVPSQYSALLRKGQHLREGQWETEALHWGTHQEKQQPWTLRREVPAGYLGVSFTLRMVKHWTSYVEMLRDALSLEVSKARLDGALAAWSGAGSGCWWPYLWRGGGWNLMILVSFPTQAVLRCCNSTLTT